METIGAAGLYKCSWGVWHWGKEDLTMMVTGFNGRTINGDREELLKEVGDSE